MVGNEEVRYSVPMPALVTPLFWLRWVTAGLFVVPTLKM
jgi:hypothetical protein